MKIKPIRNDDELNAVFQRLEMVFQAPDGSSEADEMEVLVTLVEAYEPKYYPIDAILYKADEGALTKAEFKQIKKSHPRPRAAQSAAAFFNKRVPDAVVARAFAWLN